MIEFANLRNHNQCPNGVYVIPLPENINIWYGVLFIHKGYYKGAVLKFRIDIPISYPNSSPSVTFLTDVFHPLVDKNGQLNLEFKFPSWTPRYDHIIDILKFIKSCFKVAVLNNITEEATFNKQAYQLYNNEPHLFARLSQQCTRLSQSEQVAFENPEEDNPINFIPLTNNKFEELYPQFLGPTGSKIIHGTSNSLKQTSSLDNVISNIKKSVSTNINKLFD
ncbi:UBC-like protein [Neoconidiobolus thromboides FSU 785]|nr:UBC-like protein [Neoconidiobolus thromboides FSU 785]